MSEDPNILSAPAVDSAAAEAAADVVIDASRAAAAALAVTAALTPGQEQQVNISTAAVEEPTVAVIDSSNEITENIEVNLQDDTNTVVNVEEVTGQPAQRSVSESPAPASTSGSLVPATGMIRLINILLV